MFISSSSYRLATPEILQALEYCEQVTRTHAKTFYFASMFLPREKRQACYSVYAFCRYIDDIADQPGEEAIGDVDRQNLLDLWTLHLRDIYLGKRVTHPIMIAWAHTMKTYHIPIDHALMLIEGVRMDLSFVPIRTFEELEIYCYKVASVVGLMTARIFRFTKPEALDHARHLGTAMQLTNILRDVGEDWERGRIYLPQEDMEAFGLSPTDLSRRSVTPSFRSLMQFSISRARLFYDRAEAGISMLEKDSRFTVRLMATNYRNILDDIERHDYDVFSRRAHVSFARKLVSIPTVLVHSVWKNRTRIPV